MFVGMRTLMSISVVVDEMLIILFNFIHHKLFENVVVECLLLYITK